MAEGMNEESRLYLERAAEALATARDNLRLSHPGVAASQAYYAMFYAAHALLAAKDLTSSKHSGVIALFGQHFAKPKLLDPLLHQWLADAFGVRIEADYEVLATTEPSNAQRQIERAEKFVAEAQRWLDENVGA